MATIHLLSAGQTYDLSQKVVEIRQLLIGNGPYSNYSAVVYRIINSGDGYLYDIINLQTKNMIRTEIIRPLSKKHGIGIYFDEDKIEFMDHKEFQKLVQETLSKQNEEEENDSLPSDNFSLSEILESNPPLPTGSFEIVEYSEKCIAVFGDTYSIKDDLYGLKGKLSYGLTYKGEKKPGFIFSKKREEAVREYFRVKHNIQ